MEWRYHVMRMTFRALPSAEDECDTTSSIPADILRVLEMYERKEIASLLELAIWKVNICRVHFSSVQEMKEYPVLDSSFDPSEYARTRRVTSGCTVVITQVISFLGWDKNVNDKWNS